MALENEGNGLNVSMPVQPMMGYGNAGGYGVPYAVPVMNGGNNNDNGFGGDGWWILLLFLLAGNGSWGFGGGFGGMGGMMGMNMMGLGYDFPWLLNGQNQINNNVSDGFRDAQLHDSVTSVRDGISNLSTQLCGCCGDIQMGIAGINQGVSNAAAGIQNSLCQGFAGTTAAVTNAQNAIAQQMYNNELNSLNRSFAAQTANMQGFNGVQNQLAQCCCDNKAGLADVRYTIATEECATRNNSTQNTRDIIEAQTRGTQAILDKLCQLELDGVKQNYENRIAGLQNALDQSRADNQGLRFAASQIDQTAQIRASQATTANQLVNELRSCPIPSQPVFGNQPIFTCQPNYNNGGCGCGNF